MTQTMQTVDQFKILADLDQAIVQQERLRQGQELVAAMLAQVKADFATARGATDEIVGKLVEAGMAKGAVKDMIAARLNQFQTLGLIGEPLVPSAGVPVAASGSVADAGTEQPKQRRRRRTKEEMAAARAAEQQQAKQEEAADQEPGCESTLEAETVEETTDTAAPIEPQAVEKTVESETSADVADQPAEAEVSGEPEPGADLEGLADEAWDAAAASLQQEPAAEPAEEADLGADLDAFDLPEDAGDLGAVNWDSLEEELAADEPAVDEQPAPPVAANGIPSIYKRAG